MKSIAHWKNNPWYFSRPALYFRPQIPYAVHVPIRYRLDYSVKEEHKMLRLLGILTLGNMIFGGHRHHYHHHCHRLGRGILLGTLLGLFVSRANRSQTEES